MKWLGLILIILLLVNQTKTKPKQLSKYEKTFRECSNTNECKEKPYDENCIYRCVSEICYREVYGNYLLEFGEVNTELRNKFEKCFNMLNK